jgi:hypothetical protein
MHGLDTGPAGMVAGMGVCFNVKFTVQRVVRGQGSMQDRFALSWTGFAYHVKRWGLDGLALHGLRCAEGRSSAHTLCG